MRGRLSVVTVGCKANFADSAAILTHAARAGFEVVEGGAPADVLVINSCTVTRRADRDCRALARRLRREHPGAVLVMTGCFAETTPEARASVPEVDHWLGIREPSALPRLLRSLAGDAPSPDEELSDFAADRLLGHSRVFLKVQDGCDAACAYCVVPKARGAGRSLPRREIVERAVRAEGDGAREIVLTGIHAGRYGADRGRPGRARGARRGASPGDLRVPVPPGLGRAPGDHVGARFPPLHARPSLPAPARSAAERLRPGAPSDAAAVYGEAVS